MALKITGSKVISTAQKELSFPLQSSEGLQVAHAQSPGLARCECPWDPHHLEGSGAAHFGLIGLPQSSWHCTEHSIRLSRKTNTQYPPHMHYRPPPPRPQTSSGLAIEDKMRTQHTFFILFHLSRALSYIGPVRIAQGV